MSNIKWEIKDAKRADNFKLELIHSGDDVLLVIDTKYIPDGMSVKDFIDFIQKEGIVIRR